MFLKSTQIQALILLLWQSMAVLVFSMPLDFSIAGYNPSSTNAEKLKLAQLFEQWMVKHEKTYALPEDKLRGFENFMKNYEYMNQRKTNGDHLVGLNNLADLSNEEFREKYLSNKFGMGKRIQRRAGLGSESNYESCNAPSSLNWKEKGVVTPVKDQGHCGSCWSFSSTGAIEAINAIKGNQLISLSEQELVDCVTMNSGCQGGYMQDAFDWVANNGGINTESGYPYTATNGSCNIRQAANNLVTIDGYEDVEPTDEAFLCALQKQPISVSISAHVSDFMLYKGGIYDGNCSNDPFNISHAVLLVGYGSENGTDYWILKNSWSTKWGDQGYMYMKRDKTLPFGKCAILAMASYPTKKHNEMSTENASTDEFHSFSLSPVSTSPTQFCLYFRLSLSQVMAGNFTGGKEHQHVHSNMTHVTGQLEQKLAGLVLDKKDADANLNTNSTPDSQEKWERDTDEWPMCPTPFPDLKPPATWAATLAMVPPPPPVSPQCETLAKAANIQSDAIKATKKFFSAIKEEFGSVSDDELVSESGYEFESSDSESEAKPDMDEFFDGLFEKDHKLREYYETNSEKGDFYCFICQVREDFKGKGMRYKSGLALVQHANTVSKVGSNGAHRALARAICRVLEWDSVKIPGTGVRSPSEVAVSTGDSGTEEKKEGASNAAQR
ncbi:hypothetical protein LUZ61_012715 [Rhynchospora tenuis]|uniref:Uncharacterized protein n=1 Tax=Rhynchospora tenuis TaxID=198213 RepID=A0AAD6A3L2_9POAL|nr:hypothetical protein LUZ61_012715 [Rhynchospora tenuis]